MCRLGMHDRAFIFANEAASVYGRALLIEARIAFREHWVWLNAPRRTPFRPKDAKWLAEYDETHGFATMLEPEPEPVPEPETEQPKPARKKRRHTAVAVSV